MQLSPKTKIDELLKDYPFLMDFFLSRSPKFKLLESSLMRKTVGRMATLTQVASIGGIEPATLLSEIAAEIRAKTGQEVAVSGEAAGTEVGVLREPEARIEVLKDIIKDLHKGVDMPVLKKRFSELISHIDPSEIAKMEQRLMEEGMPETEVKRLCDVHVQVFKESLEQQEVPATPAGHPVNTLMMENRAAEDIILAIEGILETLNESPDKDLFRQHQKELRNLIDSLEEINLHYLRKENQLFPILEKHNISGPSEVMWAIHDDIRQTLKYAREQVTELQVPLAYGTIKYLLQSIKDMIYKEEHILFPMALEMLSDADWIKVSSGEEEVGYAWITPERGWGIKAEEMAEKASFAAGKETLDLDTGHMTPQQVNFLLKHLPLDLSFVNENDEVVYYSQTEDRIFPRSPGVIGRKVQKCHPPKSFHMVQKILDEFRAGTKNTADFWIQMKGRFILIRYFAVRDEKGSYKGTLEVSQDVTEIRKLEGQKRLLDWD